MRLPDSTTAAVIFAVSFIVLAVHAQEPTAPPELAPVAKLDLRKFATEEWPYVTHQIHNNGRFYNTIVNNGMTGNIFGFEDNKQNKAAPSFYYPRYSRVPHGVVSGLWVGGVLRNDTLVSTAVDETFSGWEINLEFWPDLYPDGAFKVRSTDMSSPYYDPRALAQLEFECDYTDTFVYQSFMDYNQYDQRYHKPLNLHVTQTSYSWSYKYAEDFIIVDYAIQNIGLDTIKDAFAGIYYEGAVYHVGELPYPRLDDLEGYINTLQHEFSECGTEKLNIAWICDNDGQPNGPRWDFLSTVNGFGIAPLRVPPGAYVNNFNWWADSYGTNFNWGPRMKGTFEYPYREFPEGPGKPLTDRNRYYMMSKPEIDYSGYEAARDMQKEGWLAPHEYAEDIADGHFVHFLTSFGPFMIAPRQTQHLTVVMSIGEDVHTNPRAYRDLFGFEYPYVFMEYLNMDELVTNVRWAKRVYDNPGVDTDRDGDSGRFEYHYVEETGESLKVYCEGDGVPDFRGATPPPPPPLRLITEEGRITVRWNGRITENYFDVFTGAQDFEGYRVYLARSPDENDITLVASFDLEDYNRYKWNNRRERFELTEVPFTMDSLRALYGESFQPLEHRYDNPYYVGDDVYYFTKVDYNSSDLLDPSGIHRMYPDATRDTTDVDEEGRMRYYEYEYVIDNLLPTIPYYVAVTAFDFGYPSKSLEMLESTPAENLTHAFAIPGGENVLEKGKLNVYVYPNPYRIDADYPTHGFENRFTDLAPDRARNIYFANVPNRCTISVFSLGGDLIRRFEHHEPPASVAGSVARFDLITRNTQTLVSGLYYWLVESEFGSQIGKLVVIR